MKPAPDRMQRIATRALVTAGRIPGLRRLVRHPVIALPGYWFATACAMVWGGILSTGRIREEGGVIVASGCPSWAYGRGGTTIGAVYLTRDRTTPGVLEHEAVHRAQWRRYGLAFVLLYLAAGQDPLANRFEIEAGLEKAGYRRPRSRNGSDDQPR
jgi:hypothetical protein